MTKPELVDLSEIKFNKSNPNVMTDEQMNSLGEFMQRIGFRIPIQVRLQDKQIIDGAHRTRWLLDNGITKGLVSFIDCTKAEARKYRIIFNELHGTLDQNLYAQNLIEIQKAGELEDFASLMVKEEQEFQNNTSLYAKNRLNLWDKQDLIEMESTIQTKEIPEIEDSNPHFKSCTQCIHVKTCGAYTAFADVLNEMEKKYEFVKKPFPAESLAVTCTEFIDVRELAVQKEIEN